jgi:hypothetical protein
LDFHEQNLISPFFAPVPKRNAEIATLRPRSASLVSVE